VISRKRRVIEESPAQIDRLRSKRVARRKGNSRKSKRNLDCQGASDGSVVCGASTPSEKHRKTNHSTAVSRGGSEMHRVQTENRSKRGTYTPETWMGLVFDIRNSSSSASSLIKRRPATYCKEADLPISFRKPPCE